MEKRVLSRVADILLGIGIYGLIQVGFVGTALVSEVDDSNIEDLFRTYSVVVFTVFVIMCIIGLVQRRKAIAAKEKWTFPNMLRYGLLGIIAGIVFVFSAMKILAE